jgi:tetratricopeptide (TPR) repeat protein
MSDHPSDAQLRQLARAQLAPEAAEAIALHLRGRCRECGLRLLREVRESDGAAFSPPAARDVDYELAIDRAAAGVSLHGPQAVAKKRKARRIQQALAEGGLPRARKVRGWGACYAVYEALLSRAWELRFDDLQEMLRLTNWACVLAPRLGRDGYSEAQVADFQARAWGEHGNALRIARQLPRAEEALLRAAEYWELGTCDRDLALRLMDFSGSLLGDQQRYDEAGKLLADSYAGYLEIGDLHRAGRALIKRANYLGNGGDPLGAVRMLDEALALLDPAGDPAPAAIAVNSKIWFLAIAGKFRQARAALWKERRAMARFREFGQIHAGKLLHLAGYINAGLGELDRAARDLAAARDMLPGDELRWPRSLVSLDLAAVWMRQERVAEARQLAAETARDLLALGLPVEAERALGVLRDALERQVATAALVQSVVEFLRRVEHQPEARFEARPG